MPSNDPRSLLASAPMSARQIVVIAIAIALNGLDGYDVLAISFASPGIAAEWGISRAVLGIVLPMELVGMGVGSIVLGTVADRLGRRPLALGCLVIMAFGMFMTSTVRDLYSLCAWRVLTGLGIGGMLATANALTAEFASDRHRTMAVAWYTIGYPIGAVALGWCASELLVTHDWRMVFRFGAVVTAAMIPVVWFLVPESVHWLCRVQPPGALEKINRALTSMRHAVIEALPARAAVTHKVSTAEILTPALLPVTVVLTAAYFLHIITFYYILKWIPKIVVEMGFAAPLAGKVLVWANVGGAVGGAIFGWLATRVPLRTLTMVVMLVGGVMVIVFGRGQPDLQGLAAICAIAGFFTNAAIVGLYAMLAHYYPTHLRATGTGFAIGVGRGGAALGPALAGFLFQGGMTLQHVSIVMACGSFLGLLTLFALRPLARN
jgi:benzoate transport